MRESSPAKHKLSVHVCGLDCQSSNKDAGPSETAAAMALKADLVFKRSESMCHRLYHAG